MTDINELDADQLKILEKVEKLFRLAAKNPNHDEAAAATAKAQELLVAYNLSAELVGNGGQSSDAVREKQKVLGGMYNYQRHLWSAVSSLNFCLHWVVQVYTERNTRRRGWDGTWVHDKVPYMRHQHIVVGKRVNARMTVTMAQYLEQAIERLVKERYPLNSQRFLSEAVAYREGIADEIYWRLIERRRALVKEEEERRMRNAAHAGVSTSQALTIGSLTEQEEDANRDFLYGEGYSARNRARRAEQAAAEKAAEDAYTQWAATNPEQAAKEEREAAKRRRKGTRSSGGQGSRGGLTGAEKRQGMGSYWQGREKGKTIGLEPQTADRRTDTKRLT